ncbi:MAG: hypothetical protein OJF60_003267 [Burkholderiaceae bacterium]|jgi:hypothetical protein|nr:MAG: hypothetical protein OJF60_003267 [Burkholderiaceae bacterium]
MTDSQRDAIYTALCNTMTGLGEANAPLFLARFALLAIERLDDAEDAQRLIDAAAADMQPAASA